MTSVELRPWTVDDLSLLERNNTPEMTVHLGGPESPEKVVDRNARYVRGWREGTSSMFSAWVDGEPVGLVGYWPVTHQGHDVYECAYGIFPEFQGRGLAAAAMTACLEHAAAHGDRDDVYAYPNVTNGPSNALCERLGFELEGEQDFEYPKGHPIRANAWRYRLAPLRAG
ncbi:MAG TPA: GNAT family N-acetyltransferase [Lapillicoccus sp.]|nr:GNAT family N-acetyltransferase [Lapillicoccus sp.]